MMMALAWSKSCSCSSSSFGQQGQRAAERLPAAAASVSAIHSHSHPVRVSFTGCSLPASKTPSRIECYASANSSSATVPAIKGLVAKDKFHVSYRGAALSKSLEEVLTNALRYFLRRPQTDEDSY